MAFCTGDVIGYEDIAAKINLATSEDISAQAVSKKLANAEPFFQSLLGVALSRAAKLGKRDEIGIAGVGDILLADASIIALRESLAAVLPGTGGSGPAAALKLHAAFNLTTRQFSYLSLTKGTTSDHSAKQDHIALSKPGDLWLRDLGYFDIADLAELQRGGRFFVSRVPLKVTQFANADGPLDIWESLASSPKFTIDLALCLGAEAFETRVLALRLPRKKWKERLAQTRQEKGRPLTTRETAQAKWNLYATNLTEGQASAATIQKLYALRWQIELLFKGLKSALDMDSIKGARSATVAKAFVWARLVCAAILLGVRAIVAGGAAREIGLLRWMRRVAAIFAQIRDLIVGSRWLALARLLVRTGLRHCVAEKHSKPTSRQKVRESIALDRTRPAGFKP